jgi:hypothetical protein
MEIAVAVRARDGWVQGQGDVAMVQIYALLRGS